MESDEICVKENSDSNQIFSLTTSNEFSNYHGLIHSQKVQYTSFKPEKQSEVFLDIPEETQKSTNDAGLAVIGRKRIQSLLGLEIKTLVHKAENASKLPDLDNPEQPEGTEELDDLVFDDTPVIKVEQYRWNRCNTWQRNPSSKPEISSPISSTPSANCLTRFEGWDPEEVNEILEELKTIIRELNRLGEKPVNIFKEIEKQNGTFDQLYKVLEQYDDVARVAALQNQMFMLINSTCCKTVKNKMILLMEKMEAIIEGNQLYMRRRYSRVPAMTMMRSSSMATRKSSGESTHRGSFYRTRRNTDPGTLRFMKRNSFAQCAQKGYTAVTLKSLTEEFIDLTKSEIWETRYMTSTRCRRCSATTTANPKRYCFLNLFTGAFIALIIAFFVFLLVIASLCTYTDLCPAWSTQLCDNWFQGHCTELKLNKGHFKEHWTHLKNGRKRHPETHKHTHDH